ncbi:MAG: phosphate acetyltransferase [Bacillota bacterium]
MNVEQLFKQKARDNRQTIVLPEGTEPRILQAAALSREQELAELILLGDQGKITDIADSQGIDLDGIQIINPDQSALVEKFTNNFYELRRHKEISRREAEQAVQDPLYFGTMMVHTDMAQGMVAGSINPTGDVLRPGFQIIKTSEGISVVSGAMIMEVPDTELGADGIFIFADCAVNPVPDAAQLAEIAICSARTADMLPGLDPEVALLSFSTKGSASHELVEKVQQATEIAADREPELSLDGELQADAALVPTVAEQKAPDSSVAGKANVLIFPDLQAGNIGYKLVERLAGARAIGPILQGMAKPINDLSRGCSVEDIVNVVAITATQAQ